MGRPKQLLPVNGIPAVRRCAEAILRAGLRDVVVVIGADGGAIEAVVRDLPVRTVHADRPGGEMIDSVRAGLRAVLPSAAGVLLCLADHALVAPATIEAVLAEGAAFPLSIIIPVHRGRRGHPTLFPRPLISDAASGRTLRDIITRHGNAVRLLAVGDEGVVMDMDRQEDYEAMQKRGEEAGAQGAG
jgi:molybdenum cofactor cytidylyltransferase